MFLSFRSEANPAPIYPTVPLSAKEATILAKAGIAVEGDKFDRDPVEISTAAKKRLDEATAERTTWKGTVSYWTGLCGETYCKAELATDLNEVATRVTARGAEKTPTAPPADTTSAAKAAFVRGISYLSHSAATYAGKEFRTV